MSSSDHPDSDVVDPLTDDPLAFLYEAGDGEDDEDAPDEHPGYGSLMGVGVRKSAKTGKAMAIALDEIEANRAAEVMEINAGQLMTNPDRSHRQIGFLGLDPLDAAQEEEEEDYFAENLAWEPAAEEEDDADWQPENPLAGTGIAQQDDDDPDWQPENPLAGTAFAEQDEDGWQPENPLAGTGLAEAGDWAEPAAPVDEPATRSVNGFADEAYADETWATPAPPVEPPALEDEPAWSAPVEAEATLEAPEEIAAEAIEPAPLDEWPITESEAAPAESAPVEWHALLAKKRDKKPVELPPIDWGEFAAEEYPAEAAPAEDAAPEPGPLPDHGWAEAAEDPYAAPAAQAAPVEPDWQAFTAEADEAAQMFEPEWQTPFAVHVEETIAEPPADPAFAPEPGQIEVVRFPAPPPVEVYHHSLRARVMKANPPRTPPPSRIKPVLKWLGAKFVHVVLPQLKRLFAWVMAKWAELSARPPRA